MESRMEKYYKDDLSNFTRVKKNEKIYKDISGQISELDNLPIPDNSNEIDINGLKKIISSRDEYRKAKELNNTFERDKPLRAREEVRETAKEENKVYDINVLLENAKNEINRSAEVTNTKKIGTNFLTGLNDAYIPPSDDAVEIANEVTEEEKKVSNTDSLPLDILMDLKGDDNTVVTNPIVKEEVTMIKKIKEGETFYSGSFNFTKKDFEEDDDEKLFEEKSHTGIKVFFLILGFLVLGVAIYFIITKYVL